MGVLERAFEAARRRPGRVLLPERDEPRVAEAAARLAAEGLAEPVWLSGDAPDAAEIAAVLAARPRATPAIAARMLEKPLFRAGAMLAAGRADVLVAGADSPTRRVIEAASMTVGMAEGVAIPSSFFLMRLPDGREMIFADCAVNVAPDAAGLAAIALASARSAEALLGAARVAMLSFSTLSSGAGPSVDAVRSATARLRAAGVEVTGPVQADAALNPVTARRKGLEAAGAANVLVFPSLDAGNIAYKLVQELAGAQAVGPFLQGFARPVCDLSRGATADDIVAAAAVTLAMR
jgi:phosphate acetyltransferase